MEGSPPDHLGDHNVLRHVAPNYGGGTDGPVNAHGVQRVATLTLSDVVMAILESRASYPLAASAALIREGDGDGTAVHLVLLDEEAAAAVRRARGHHRRHLRSGAPRQRRSWPRSVTGTSSS